MLSDAQKKTEIEAQQVRKPSAFAFLLKLVKKEQLDRYLQVTGMTMEEYERRVRTQWARYERRRHAHRH